MIPPLEAPSVHKAQDDAMIPGGLGDSPPREESPPKRGVIRAWTRDHFRALGRMGAPFYLGVLLLVGLVLVAYLEFIPWGNLMGGDIGEYLATASAIVHGKSVVFAYPFPILPLFYIPIVLAVPNAVNAVYLAGALSAVFLGAVFAGAYVLFYRDTRSRWGAVIGAFVLPTTPILLVEVSWTGQAQFAAMAFGLLALATLLKWGERPTFLRVLLSGVLLALAVLCEGYSGTYFVLAFTFTGLLTYRLRLVSWAWLSRILVWIVPLAITYGALYALDGSSVAGSLDRLLIYGLGTPGLLTYLTNLYDHGAPLILGATFVIFLAYAIVVIFRPSTRPRPPPLVIGGLLALLPLALFLTSVPFTERAMYFLCVPLGAAVARLTSGFVPGVTTSSAVPSTRTFVSSLAPISEIEGGPAPRRSLWRRSVEALERPQAQQVIAMLVILLVGAQVGLGSQALPKDMTGYEFPSTDVSQLTWLRGEPGAVLYDGNLKGPTDFAAGRPIYPDLEPVYLNVAQQRADAIVAATVLTGPQWINAGNVQVIDSNGTEGEVEPLIMVYDAPYYLPTFYLDDALENFWYSPNNNLSITYVESLLYAHSTTRSVVNGAEFTDSYDFPGEYVNKTTFIDPGVGVEVHLQYNFTESVPRWITVRATASLPVTEASISSSKSTSTSVATESYGSGLKSDNLTATVQARVANASLVATYVPSDQWGYPELDWNLSHIPAGRSVVDAWITFEWPTIPISTAHVVEEASLLASTDIEWVVIQKGVTNQFLVVPRLKIDPEFALWETTSNYIIFHVV